MTPAPRLAGSRRGGAAWHAGITPFSLGALNGARYVPEGYVGNFSMRLRLFFLVIASLTTARTFAEPPPPEINLRKTIIVEVVRKTKDAVVNVSTTKLV